MGRRCFRPHRSPICTILGVLCIALGMGMILAALLPWCNLFLALVLISIGIWLVCQTKFH